MNKILPLSSLEIPHAPGPWNPGLPGPRCGIPQGRLAGFRMTKSGMAFIVFCRPWKR
ncbi:MAG TPA: hypothetical protein VE868_05725 [Balneolaceae bacterium]|nr:hypothetical protein [Balneolaceae bacterium]